jgi:hyaluronan synthase
MALARGKVVQRSDAFALTLMPERWSHHVRQQIRWMRGTMLRDLTRLQVLPLRGFGYWYSLVTLARRVIGVIMLASLVFFSVIHAADGAWWLLVWIAGFACAMQTLISVPYLAVDRADQTRLAQLGVFGCAPLVALWQIGALWVIEAYSMVTYRHSAAKWGTRQRVEVAA